MCLDPCDLTRIGNDRVLESTLVDLRCVHVDEFSSTSTLTRFDSSSISATRRTPASAARGAIAGKTTTAGGVLTSGEVADVTRNCMIWPVVSGSAGSKSTLGSPPTNGSSGAKFSNVISAHAGIAVKSTMTLTRSAGASSIWVTGTAAVRLPRPDAAEVAAHQSVWDSHLEYAGALTTEHAI